MKRLLSVPILLMMISTGIVIPAMAQSVDKITVTQQPERSMLQFNHNNSGLQQDSLYSIQVMDSATAMQNWLNIQQANQKGNKVKGFDHMSFMKDILKQKMKTPFTQPPLSVRTQAGEGNEVKVFVTNRSSEVINDIDLDIQLPEGWSLSSQNQPVATLPTGEKAIFTFELTGPDQHSKLVSFGLNTENGLSIGWTALIQLSEDSQKNMIPATFEVHGNYPNPFNPTTTFSYSLPARMEVRLEIFNLLGQRVATLVDGTQTAGLQNITWDARSLASGTYLYRIVAKAANGQQFLEQKTLVLLK